MERAGEIVLIDPIHPGALAFLTAARRRGMRSVCLWTSSRVRSGSWRYPELSSEAVAAHYPLDLDDAGLDRMARLLRDRHHVVAVIPHVEPWVVPSVVLSEALGLSWAQPDVMPLFRDKHALKRHLATVPGGPRINRVALVTSATEVRTAMEELDLAQVVVKPNDGYGNMSVGFFDRDTPQEAIAAHFGDQSPQHPTLLEERLVGVEHFVNGQVNAAGDVDVTRVGTYDRTSANGRSNVKLGDHSVRTHEPEFGLLADYARAVMQASGVRRTPFHLECMVDDDGPCLIEVGARFMNGDSSLDAWLHDTDLVDAALVQYLGDGTSDGLCLDWQRYDSVVAGPVLGVNDTAGRIGAIHGLADAEAMPGFLNWQHRPEVGDKVVATVDLFGAPWRAVVVADDLEGWRRRSDQLRETVRLDVIGHRHHPPLRWLRSLLPAVTRLGRRAWARVTFPRA